MSKNWVLLRGLARHSKHWGPFAELFIKAHQQDNIEFIDLRGNGTEVDKDSFLKIPDYTDDVRLRSKSIARGERVNIIAVSMGAMVAVDWASRFHHEVESITCINTSDGGSSHFWERLRPESYKPLAQILLNNSNQQARERLSLDLITNSLKNKNEIAKIFAPLTVTTRTNFFKQIFAASKFRFPRQKPNCDVTMICADGDRLVNSKCTKNICKHWGISPVIHESAGHDLPLDAPDWLLSKIKS